MTGRNEAGAGPDDNPYRPRAIKADKADHETSHLMSEPTTPSKGPTKRRGLALPPRGQALARLQDLEQDSKLEQDSEEDGASNPTGTGDQDKEPALTEGSNAVNTACSNAVNHQGSSVVQEGAGQTVVLQPEAAPIEAIPEMPARSVPVQEPVVIAPETAAAGFGRGVPARAAREPTTRITVDMPDSLHRKISLLSVDTRRSIKDLVIEALAVTYFGADANRQQDTH